MPTSRLGTFGRISLRFFLPMGILLAGFVGAMKLLHPSPVIAQYLSVGFAVIVLGYSLVMGRQESRRWDEVQRAGAGFAHSTGWVWGGFATLFLLTLPGVATPLVEVAMNLRAAGSVAPEFAMRLGLTFGAVLVMVMQTLAIIIASVIWGLGMRGSQDLS